jgi:hypothetical protein
MKFIKYINLLLLLILPLSCNDNPGVLSTEGNNREVFTKNSEIDNTTKSNFIRNGNDFRYDIDRGFEKYPPGADSIFIPIGLPIQVIPELANSKVINGTSGGILKIYFVHRDEKISVTIDAVLTIPPGAFSGSKRIWMVLNNEFGTIWFYPHLVFDVPVQFDIQYRGINLLGINSGTIDFIFQSDDGTIEQVNYNSLDVLQDTGYLTLKGGMLNHFSRYGWSR